MSERILYILFSWSTSVWNNQFLSTYSCSSCIWRSPISILKLVYYLLATNSARKVIATSNSVSSFLLLNMFYLSLLNIFLFLSQSFCFMIANLDTYIICDNWTIFHCNLYQWFGGNLLMCFGRLSSTSVLHALVPSNSFDSWGPLTNKV